MSDYDQLATIYDLDLGYKTNDIPMYLRYAQMQRSPILTESLDGEIRKEFGIEDEYHLAFLSTESFVIANHPINIFDSLPIARKIAVLRTTVLPYFTVEIPMFMR